MKKIKIIAILAVSFVVFATTLFALAQSQNSSSLFLDSDQDGLTDQEERMIGTDPFKADTDGDGYSDGKEVESGYNPLKAAPGDKIVPAGQSATPTSSAPVGNSTVNSDSTSSSANAGQSDANSTNPTADFSAQNLSTEQTDPTTAALLAQMGQTDVLSTDAAGDLSSDPNNPNLTNEMVGQLLQLTKDKATTDTSFADNPTFSSDDIAQMTQGALQTVDIAKSLPEIKDGELNILPEVNDKNLSADEIKTKQKIEIETYLAQIAFIMASNSPFPVDQPQNLQSQVSAESANLLGAVTSGDNSKVDTYVQKAQAGIDQLKKVEIPFVLKDQHKSMLQLALYTLSLKDQISLNTSDPMKSLAAASTLQAVVQKATDLQDQLSKILSDYGINSINFP